MEDYNSGSDEDYIPDESCDCIKCVTIDDCSDCDECSCIEFDCPECLALEIEKQQLLRQLARFMTLFKASEKKIKELQTKLKKK